jgi:hypothetical protein
MYGGYTALDATPPTVGPNTTNAGAIGGPWDMGPQPYFRNPPTGGSTSWQYDQVFRAPGNATLRAAASGLKVR